ncbi:TPA: hypothetical protein QC181_006810, partial [Bacillus cereus]|nr:hypothetical protein [Bacillus cereus]
MANEKYHPDFYVDLASIDVKLAERFDLFLGLLLKEKELLHKYPIENTAQLKKPTLSYYGYRKVKFHSSNPREKSNMRLIYRYIEDTDTLQFLAVGFRRDTPKNIYEIAEER